MGPIFTFCGYFCAFAACVGIFFFIFLISLEARGSRFLDHFFNTTDSSGQIMAMGLAIGLNIVCMIGCFSCTFYQQKKQKRLQEIHQMEQEQNEL